MPTKIFKIIYGSGLNLTEDNLSTMLRRWFCEDIKVKELLKTPRVAMNLVKNKINSAKHTIKRNRVLRKNK